MRNRHKAIWVVLVFLVLLLTITRLFLSSSYFDLHPNPNKKVLVVFRNDDIQEFSGSEAERRFIHLFVTNGIPQTYALVPFKKNLDQEKELIAILREQQKRGLAEIALHGYTHENHGGKRKSEFAVRPLKEQAEAIAKGKTYLEKLVPTKISSFIPPFNNYDLNTLQACVQNNLTVLSSSSFFHVPNPFPINVINHNFLLTDPVAYLELAAVNGGMLSIFIVYYHSYMEEIYKGDDYYGKAGQLIQVIKRHKNIEVTTLNNLSRYAEYFKEIRTRDSWRAKTSALLGFYGQGGLAEKLAVLCHCNEKSAPLFIVTSLFYIATFLFFAGFIAGLVGKRFLRFFGTTGKRHRYVLAPIAFCWLLSIFLVVAHPDFGIIDKSFVIILTGFLVGNIEAIYPDTSGGMK